MTIPQYETEMRRIGGVTIADLLKQGWTARVESRSHSAGGDGDAQIEWRNARAREIADFLRRLDDRKWLSEQKYRTAIQMALGRLARGESLRAPPDPTVVQDTDLLFRGTTIDTSTKRPYLGSAGSAAATPTTPSPTHAALFATKGATEWKAEGTVVWGTMGSVRPSGFAPADVMAGQEQELSVLGAPSAVNELLIKAGGTTPLPAFREMLEILRVSIPEKLSSGTEFDDRLLAARQLQPLAMEELKKMLVQPGYVEGWRTERRRTSDLNLKLTPPLRERAKNSLAAIDALANNAQTSFILAEVKQANDKLEQAISSIPPKAANNEKEKETSSDEEFNLFDDEPSTQSSAPHK